MNKPVIICVDDEPTILESLKIELKKALGEEYTIETAEGGADALELIIELIEEEKYEVPLVISDYFMPDIKGDELLKQIHSISPKTIKILLTGQADLQAVSNAIKYAQLYRYIAKPWHQSDLILTVREAIRSYSQDKQLADQNVKLQQLNEELETLVEQRTAELRLSEEKFAKAFRSSPNPITITRLSDGQHIEVNDAFCAMVGCTCEEIIGKTAIELGLWANEEDRARLFQGLVKQGIVRNYEFQFCPKTGEVRTALLSAEIIDIQGQTCVISVSQDISDRKRAEEKLRASEAFLAAAQRIAHVGSCEVDLLSNNTTWSEELFRIFDLDPNQPKPTCEEFRQYIHPDDRELWEKTFNSILVEGKTHKIEYRIVRSNGSIRHIEARGEPVFSQQGQIEKLLIIMMDISDRKQAEIALQKAKEAADKANRAKSEFLSNMSHELRTPLNAILGFTQLLARDSSLKSEQKEHLGIISRSGEHLLNLINNILQMSKIEVGQVTVNKNNFDLYHLLESIEKMFQLQAEKKNLQLIIDIAPDLPQYVQTDESKLRQTLINILGNAIKFTQEGGVTLRVRMKEEAIKNKEDERISEKEIFPVKHLKTLDLESIEIAENQEKIPNLESTESNKNTKNSIGFSDDSSFFLQFEIEDTGLGIAPEEIDNLFKPFVQTESGMKAQEGTGLGLPISRQFVQLMGGDITVNSNINKGSIFKFNIEISLPDLVEIQGSETTRRVIGLEAGQPEYRILAVDDRLESRLLLVRLLTSLGFSVRAAENGAVAVDLWSSWEPHLILMDMRMPVMDGYEATKQIKAHLKGQATVIIALTASAFDEERSIILSTGCDDFVAKPFREQVILEKMAKYLGVRYLYEEQVLSSSPRGRRSPSLTNQVSESGQSDSSFILEPSSFQGMPLEWIDKLYDAADSVDNDNIFQLLSEIPSDRANLSKALAQLVNNFRCDKILDLIEELRNL
ncbi:response regulator [Kamptonema animale CS-326]|jgi:PAS domain S-box-containing protein|uniref:response regulator n=1 Tax=Kamptonema animale TaxID=92934 RepID=UPI00232ECEA4|nr:response regulator [Kamptonema animale]MDB9512432.1 response regulator [Kamptonema animale CS-326]